MPRRSQIWEREGFSSRRQYENSRARAAGFENYSQYQRLRKDPEYQNLLDGLARTTGQDARTLRRLDSYINEHIADAGGDVEAVKEVIEELRATFGGEEPADYDLDIVEWDEYRDWYEEIAG